MNVGTLQSKLVDEAMLHDTVVVETDLPGGQTLEVTGVRLEQEPGEQPRAVITTAPADTPRDRPSASALAAALEGCAGPAHCNNSVGMSWDCPLHGPIGRTPTADWTAAQRAAVDALTTVDPPDA